MGLISHLAAAGLGYTLARPEGRRRLLALRDRAVATARRSEVVEVRGPDEGPKGFGGRSIEEDSRAALGFPPLPHPAGPTPASPTPSGPTGSGPTGSGRP